jgi:rod shape determining protein RodA
MKQPDLGTGLVYIVAAIAILFFMGVGWKQLTALAGIFVVAITLVLVAGPALGVNVLQSYQKQRLTTFIAPPAKCHSAIDATCYQLDESLIAIGSGGKTGRGAAGATQTKFHFLPVANEDFIFAVVGETYGFAGAAIVISLYALLIWRALRILAMSKNLFGTLIAGGILAMFMFQVFLNIGMTIGIMPVTGVPLPLLSYGGSSVIVTFLAIGLLESIHIQARMASSGKARVLIV